VSQCILGIGKKACDSNIVKDVSAKECRLSIDVTIGKETFFYTYLIIIITKIRKI